MFILSTPEISDDRCPKRQKARCAKASDVIGEVTRVTGPTAAPPGGLPAGSDRKPGGLFGAGEMLKYTGQVQQDNRGSRCSQRELSEFIIYTQSLFICFKVNFRTFDLIS